MEKAYCHFSNSGESWLSFPEPEDDSDSEGENNNGLQARHATLLPKNEMHLYGHCPAHDNFTLVTCKECGKILKTMLFARHCELYHKNILSSLPFHKASSEVKRNKSIKVMQPKVVINKLNPVKAECMEIDTIEEKIEEVPPVITKIENDGNAETSVLLASPDSTNHILKKNASLKKIGKDSPRKFIPTKDREYDPNRHCGVWVEELQKNCTRSLTCKTHALSLRRAVPGRVKEFDALLHEHRERVNIAKEQQLLSKAQNLTSSSVSNSGNKFPELRNGIASQALSGGGQFNKDVTFSLAFKSQHSNLEDDQSDLQYTNAHPKPLACCQFGARRVGPGHFVFNRRSGHLRTTVLSMVERLLHPALSRQTVGKHSVHRRYSTKTAGQSSNQGSSLRTDVSNRSRSATINATTSTVFRNSSKPRTARQTSSERNSKTSKITTNIAAQITAAVSQQTSVQRTSNPKGNVTTESPSISTSQNVRISTMKTCVGGVATPGLESALTLGKDLEIVDPAAVSVILNGPIGSGELLANHTQASVGGSKNGSQVPSPRGSYVVPASSPSPASTCVYNNNQVVNQTEVASGVSTAMSPPTVYQRQSSTGSQQLSPLVNGTAASPPGGTSVKGYTTNFVPKSSLVNNTIGISSSVGHSGTSQGQTVVFANTNISQLQGQPISQSLPTTQISQDKTHCQNNLFQRPLASPGRVSCQPPSPQIPSPGRQSPQRSPNNAPSPKYQQHSLYLNHHVPVSTQAPIAQLKQQVENQGQQLQQIKFQQLQQQQSHNPQRQLQNDQTQLQQHLQHPKQPQYRAQQRIAPAPTQPQQTTYLLQQSQPNHTISLRPASGQVIKTSNTVFITNDNPPREIQFSLSRNAANTVG